MAAALTCCTSWGPVAPRSIRCGEQAAAHGPAPELPSAVRVRTSVEDWRSHIRRKASFALLLPLAACTVFTSCLDSAEAGMLSGIPGVGSFDLPSLPSAPEIVKQIQDSNKKRYEERDAQFKSSPLVQELLRKSKENAELHRKEIRDKYCARGAEWGVGDCALTGMSQAEKDAFFEALRKGK